MKMHALIDWAPDTLVAVLALSIAAAVAMSLHNTALRLLDEFFGSRFPYIRTLLAKMHGVTRLALLVFALVITVPLVPLDYDTATVMARMLVIAFVVMIGWAAVIAVNLAADLYLKRFRNAAKDIFYTRKHVTQVRIMLRVADTLVIVFTIAAALMTFDSVRQYGVSLFASAGVAGLIAGFAARPVLSNLFAGIQIAMTQPIRIDDRVVIENESGQVEEITSTYVVVKLWDWRRMIVPITYFIEKPFQIWTRDGTELIGSVILYLDYSAPIETIRAKLKDIASQTKLWNGKVLRLQVVDAKEQSVEVRVIASANTSSEAWDLRCEIREKLIDFLQREHPRALPRQRQEAMAQNAEKGSGIE